MGNEITTDPGVRVVREYKNEPEKYECILPSPEDPLLRAALAMRRFGVDYKIAGGKNFADIEDAINQVANDTKLKLEQIAEKGGIDGNNDIFRIIASDPSKPDISYLVGRVFYSKKKDGDSGPALFDHYRWEASCGTRK